MAYVRAFRPDRSVPEREPVIIYSRIDAYRYRVNTGLALAYLTAYLGRDVYREYDPATRTILTDDVGLSIIRMRAERAGIRLVARDEYLGVDR